MKEWVQHSGGDDTGKNFDIILALAQVMCTSGKLVAQCIDHKALPA